MADKLDELVHEINNTITAKRAELQALNTKITAATATLAELTERLEGMPEKVVQYEAMKAKVKKFADDLEAKGF